MVQTRDNAKVAVVTACGLMLKPMQKATSVDMPQLCLGNWMRVNLYGGFFLMILTKSCHHLNTTKISPHQKSKICRLGYHRERSGLSTGPTNRSRQPLHGAEHGSTSWCRLSFRQMASRPRQERKPTFSPDVSSLTSLGCHRPVKSSRRFSTTPPKTHGINWSIAFWRLPISASGWQFTGSIWCDTRTRLATMVIRM